MFPWHLLILIIGKELRAYSSGLFQLASSLERGPCFDYQVKSKESGRVKYDSERFGSCKKLKIVDVLPYLSASAISFSFSPGSSSLSSRIVIVPFKVLRVVDGEPLPAEEALTEVLALLAEISFVEALKAAG